MSTTSRRLAFVPVALLLFASATVSRAEPPKVLSTKPPIDVAGVLLDDGRQIEGKYEEKAGQHLEVEPKDGSAKFEISLAHVVYAEGTRYDFKGDDSQAVALWRRAVKAGCGDAASDAGKAATVEMLMKGVEWCAKRTFVTGATALLADVLRADASKKDDVEKRAKALMPDAFFFKDAADAVQQWLVWGEALLPASAEFIGKDEDPWSRLENAPWTDGKTLAFRTRNVILFIRDFDPKICGRALQLAEGTVHALQSFLHDGDPDYVSDDLGRLEIRIHANRKDYLEEKPMYGGQPGHPAEPWSAGYFGPRENISHFYLERRGTPSVDMHELTRVLTHEFTHHYMYQRWESGNAGGPDIPGFWVVEGMAEFVQNQMHQIDKHGLAFDDDAAFGIAVTAAARRQGVTTDLLKMERFVDETQSDFAGLDDHKLLATLKPGHGYGTYQCDERGLWYDTAGALCYFFLRKKGPEMREKFIDYVRRHYRRGAPKPAWKFLGYESADALDKDFLAFLATVGG